MVAFALIPRFTPMILAGFAALCLALAVYHHSSLFSNEYRNMNWANTAGAATPYLMIILIILLSVGYILMLVTSGKAPSLPSFSTTIPPPSTATNTLTQAIGTGLASTNMARVSPYNNAPSRNILNSALSKAV